MIRNIVICFKNWYNILEVKMTHVTPDSILDCSSLSTMKLLNSSKYKINLVNKKEVEIYKYIHKDTSKYWNNMYMPSAKDIYISKEKIKLEMLSLGFRLSEKLVCNVSKEILKKYIIKGFFNKIERELNKKDWKCIYITDMNVQLYLSKQTYISTNKLRKLFCLKPKSIYNIYNIYTTLYIGGY